MKRILIFLTLIILLLIGAGALSSCRKLISDTFPDMSPKPTVNALIRNGEPISVHVSLAQKIDAMPLSSEENATVKLFVDGVFAETLTYEQPDSAIYYYSRPGYYTSSLSGELGKHYALEVSIPNLSDTLTARCETYLPHSEQILSIQFIENAGKHGEGYSVPGLRVTFANNPAERRYYELSIKTYEILIGQFSANDTTFIPNNIEIELVNISDPVILGEGLPIPVFSNRMIKDSTYTMYVEFTNGMYGSGASTDNVMRMYYDALFVELRSITPAYYHYLHSYYLYNKSINLSDIGEVYTPYPLYSNVDGGYGVFGAYSKKETYTFISKYAR